MANLIEIGITEILIIEIVEIDKEEIWSVSDVENKDIKGMTIHYGSNI
jgi:hypothetical protein